MEALTSMYITNIVISLCALSNIYIYIMDIVITLCARRHLLVSILVQSTSSISPKIKKEKIYVFIHDHSKIQFKTWIIITPVNSLKTPQIYMKKGKPVIIGINSK